MRIRLLLLLLVAIGIYCFFNWDRIIEKSYLNEINVPEENVYIFENLSGPDQESVIPDPVTASWRKYDQNIPSAMAILLTDPVSDWIGIVHGLKNIGIPVIVTDDINKALLHKTILVYPIISGKVLSKEKLQLLAAVPRNGGNLIGINVYGGGLNEVFGFDTLIASNERNQLFMPNPAITEFTEKLIQFEERNIRLTNPVDFPDELPTNGYTNAKTPLIVYKRDSTAFLTYKDYGHGHAFAFGLDLGNYFLRYMNERGFNAYRAYANHYGPGIDVVLRILKSLYRTSDNAVTIGTVPYNKDLTLILTHDIDYTKSIINAAKYGRMEDSLGVKATYFVQTKYIKDWNDDIFFTESTIRYLSQIKELGMEIGSHSISHSRVFSEFPVGSGKERYPEYRPFVKEKLQTYNGSILGELRVSKFLLESLVPEVQVVSFRPGHLEYPFEIPQTLMSTGYKYSSSVTANNVQTHLPYMQMYDRGFEAETHIVEIPITIEDELGAPLILRLDSALALAESLGSYGGVMNVLIHTDTLGGKFEFEKRLIVALKDKAWIGTIKELGKWWYVRNQIRVSVVKKDEMFIVDVINPSEIPINGLALEIPDSWVIDRNTKNVTLNHNNVVINELTSFVSLTFSNDN